MGPSRSGLADALATLGTGAFGAAERTIVVDAFRIVADDVEKASLDESVEEFLAWLQEHPRHLNELRSATPHSHLSLMGQIHRKFSQDQDPATPVGRLRRAIALMVGQAEKHDEGWFKRGPDFRIRLRDNIVGAWPVSLLSKDGMGLHAEALAHATAAMLAEAENPMTASEMARALLDHYPATFDGNPDSGPAVRGRQTSDPQPGEKSAAPDPGLWDKQHAAQLLCRFTHEELILVAGRLRNTPETEVAQSLNWPVALVRQRSKRVWEGLEEYLGLLEQKTGESADTLVRLVEEVLLEMDI